MEIKRKISCPYCQSDDWEAAKTDLGMPHWKSEESRPTRMKLQRCKDCGHIAIFAPREERK